MNPGTLIGLNPLCLLADDCEEGPPPGGRHILWIDWVAAFI